MQNHISTFTFMWTYIIVTVILFAIGILLLKLPHLEWLREKDKAFNFFMSLLSSFIAFFIALSINTHIEELNKKENLVKMLKAADLSLENSEMKIQGMYLNPANAGENLWDILQYAPLETPKIYSALETNDLVNNYFSSNAFQAYIICNDNMQSFVKRINSDKISDEHRLALLQDYKAYIKLAKNLNKVELEKLQNKISPSEETKKLQELSKSLTIK